jgi:peptidoglycan-N-acetylglucosamine deacetylase
VTRRRLGLVIVSVAVAGAAALVLTGAFGHTPARRSRRVLVAGPAQAVARRHVRSLAAVIAAGNAEIHRLVALGLPVYCGGPRGHEVAFTFDDGPGLYTHPDLVTLAPADVTAQLEGTAKLIRARSGDRVDLWRPPYGATDPTVARIARHLGLLEILWNVDSRDSLGANWAQIIRTVEAGLRPGAIVELHENRGQTICALTTLLPWLQRHHLRSVSLPELLASDPPSLRQLRAGWAGCGSRGAGRVTGE